MLLTSGLHEIIVGSADHEAILACVRYCEAAGLPPVRLCAGDWVTANDIAERVGRSREAVRLWALGRLGPGGFPPPLNPGSDTLFYSWAEVAPWLCRKGLNVAHGEPVLAAMNLALQLRHLLPQLTRSQAVLSCILHN